MFTGIVQGQGRVLAITERPGLKTLQIALPERCRGGVARGASIAIAGVCLTVTTYDDTSASFDVMDETLRLTTLGTLSMGDTVNVERSAPASVEVGGHILSGHVDTLARIVSIDRPENNCVMTFQVDPRWARFLFSKGFVALDGCSLTLVGVDQRRGTFQVWFIPETLAVTSFGGRQVGDSVNLEVERTTQVIVETVERVLHEMFLNRSGSGVELT